MPAGLGWDTLNLVSTVGAFMIAAGVALFLIDLARNFRMASEENAGNVWNAGTLEWLPTGNYSSRSIPIVTSRDPLWDQPNLADDVEAGRYYLPGRADRRPRDDRDQSARRQAAVAAADADARAGRRCSPRFSPRRFFFC